MKMTNLPMFSTICNNIIFHKGNHDHRGLPHEQYICKWSANITSNNESNVNKYTKIAEITFTEDNNVINTFIFELINNKTGDSYTVTSNLYKKDSSTTRIKYPYNDTFSIWTNFIDKGKVNGKQTWKIEYYIKIDKSYNQFFIRLLFAKNTEVSNFKNDYAYNNVTLFSNQEFLDTVDGIVQAENSIKGVKQIYYRQSWGSFTIPATSNYTVIINNSDIKWDSVVNCTYSNVIPDGVMSNICMKNGGGTVYIKFRNHNSSEVTVPSGNWNLLITQSGM